MLECGGVYNCKDATTYMLIIIIIMLWVIGLTMMRTKQKLSLILTFLHSQIGRLGFEAQGGEEVSVLASS
jgi:hypothetical protein